MGWVISCILCKHFHEGVRGTCDRLEKYNIKCYVEKNHECGNGVPVGGVLKNSEIRSVAERAYFGGEKIILPKVDQDRVLEYIRLNTED